jgi:hypothetical protein
MLLPVKKPKKAQYKSNWQKQSQGFNSQNKYCNNSKAQNNHFEQGASVYGLF